MSLIEFFENDIDLTNPNLTYSDWKTITDIGSISHFKHPITGNTRIKKFQKNAYEKYVKSLQTKIETEKFIKEILKDKTLPMKQCKGCKKWYPAIQEYKGKKVSFWVTNKGMKDGLRNLCGKWGSNCDTEHDRQSYITPENPTGIRRGGASDHSERMKHKDKILRRLVADVKRTDRIKGLECNLPDDWAIIMDKKQDGCCARSGFKFDYTHYTKEQGKNILKPSINRIDNSKPHTVENCELVLMFINLGCSDAPKELVEKVCSELLVKKAV